jgi:predicted HicB family RNase H-like nuclease
MQRGYVDRMKYEKRKSEYPAQIMLRVPPALRDKIEERAAAEGRSLANMARRLLEAATAERDDRSAAA